MYVRSEVVELQCPFRLHLCRNHWSRARPSTLYFLVTLFQKKDEGGRSLFIFPHFKLRSVAIATNYLSTFFSLSIIIALRVYITTGAPNTIIINGLTINQNMSLSELLLLNHHQGVTSYSLISSTIEFSRV